MKRFELRRSVEGLSVAAIGVMLLALIPSQIKAVVVGETRMSPSFIPSVVAIGLILAGLGLVARAYFSETPHPRLEASGGGLLRVLAAVLMLVAYAFLFPRLGFVVTSGLFAGAFIVLFGSRDWVKIGISVVAVPVAAWLFFERLFLIPLPHGFLF